MGSLEVFEAQFGVKQWESNLFKFLKTRYTPSNSRASHFYQIERQVYDSVIQLREASCGGTNGKIELDDQGFPKNLKSPLSLMLHNILGLTSYLSQIFAFESPPFRVSEDPAAPYANPAR